MVGGLTGRGGAAILADLVHYSVPKELALDRMAELEELTRTFGGVAVVKTIQRRAMPDNRTFIGKGKVDEILAQAKTLGADLLIINEVLKPQQVFNLEEALRPAKVKVWDRVDLILQIFEKHARTAEAKLEIELARLRHMGPRIFNMGAELGRQRGGTGTRGGAGEGNTEAMKRHLREQEKAILAKLAKCQSVRNEHQRNRQRHDKKTVALVGYTNAGKTSLLNALGKRKEYAADKLFATLDTRVADVYIPGCKARCCCPIPSASFKASRRHSSKHSPRHCQKPRTRICCCTLSTQATRSTWRRWR